MKIRKTTNYKQFKTLKGNREIYAAHFKNLVTSIQQKNLLRYYPILVNEKMVVIDGQHRLEAAKELKLPIYYVIAKDINKSDVILLNGNSRSWRAIDYLNYYYEQKLPDYIVMKDFMKRYGFNFNMTFALLDLPSIGSSKWNNFKAGKFQTKDLPLAKDRADALVQIRPFTRDNAWRTRNMVSAIHKFMEQLPISLLISKLKQSELKIIPATKPVYLLRQFEQVLNFRKRKDDSFIRLF